MFPRAEMTERIASCFTKLQKSSEQFCSGQNIDSYSDLVGTGSDEKKRDGFFYVGCQMGQCVSSWEI